MELLIRKDWKILAETAQSGSLLDRVLAARGFVAAKDRSDFLDCSIESLHDPFTMPGMKTAAERLARAVQSGERILVHGDYDADGLTATALLTRLLRDLGASVSSLIPDRMADGYGISLPGVLNAVQEGVTLLVTVDCGISAAEEIDILDPLGVDTILTDHHTCPPKLPNALAILNPHLPGSTYPFPDLCGAGVAYKLAQALCIELGCSGAERDLIDLAAVATIADVVPLTGENRILAAQGVASIQARPRAGLRALLTAGGQDGKTITAGTIGYTLAPRLNAAGRMGDATRALNLLMTDDLAFAALLADELATVNRERQSLEALIFSEAVEAVDRTLSFTEDEPIVVAKDGWHSGVIGIVAARLADQYQRPAIVFAGDKGLFKGSGRTAGSFDLLAAITSAAAHTVRYGGHPKAAGLTVTTDQMEAFRLALNQYSRQHLDTTQLRPVILADFEVEATDLTLDSARGLEALAPYGEANRQPAFVLKHVRLIDMKPVGSGRHLRFRFRSEHENGLLLDFEGIGFGLSGIEEDFAAGEPVDVLFHLEINRYNGQERLSLQVRDMRHARPEKETQNKEDRAFSGNGVMALSCNPQDLTDRSTQSGEPCRIPALSDFRIAYQYLYSRYGQRPVLADLSLLGRRISRDYGTDMDASLLRPILTVFADAGLVRYCFHDEDRIRFQLLPTGDQRIRLQDVPSFQKLAAQGGNGS